MLLNGFALQRRWAVACHAIQPQRSAGLESAQYDTIRTAPACAEYRDARPEPRWTLAGCHRQRASLSRATSARDDPRQEPGAVMPQLKVTPTPQRTVNNRIMGASDAGQALYKWGMVREISGRIFNCGILLRETTSSV